MSSMGTLVDWSKLKYKPEWVTRREEAVHEAEVTTRGRIRGLPFLVSGRKPCKQTGEEPEGGQVDSRMVY